MLKSEFLQSLKDNLGRLPYQEVEKIINFYDESLCDRIEAGMNEEEAVAQMGDVNAIVSDILTEHSLPVVVKRKIKDSHANSSNKTLWVVLAIIGFPIWLPLLAAGFAVLISVIAVLFALIISLFAVELSMFILTFAALVYGVVMVTTSVPIAIVSFGVAIFLFGFTLLMLVPLCLFAKYTFKLIGSIFKSIFRLFRSKPKSNVNFNWEVQ